MVCYSTLPVIFFLGETSLSASLPLSVLNSAAAEWQITAHSQNVYCEWDLDVTVCITIQEQFP